MKKSLGTSHEFFFYGIGGQKLMSQESVNYSDPSGTNRASEDGGNGNGPPGPCGPDWMNDASTEQALLAEVLALRTIVLNLVYDFASGEPSTPGGNANLATTVTYASSWAVTSLTGPNGANGTMTYDGYGRPQSTKIPDGAATAYTYAYAAMANPQTATLGTRWKRTTLDGVRAGDEGGIGARFGHGLASGCAVRTVRVLAAGESVAGTM